MNILVINFGSSSIKYRLMKMPNQDVVCYGQVERIGFEDAKIHYETNLNKIIETESIPDHKLAFERVAALLTDDQVGVIANEKDIHAVGHRVVHGGSTFSDTVLIDKSVKDKIKQHFKLAPLHNPNNFEGIIVSEAIFPSAKQVAVFDTAFHQTMPTVAHKYAIPNEFSEEHKIRAYGFHGTSNKYVTERAKETLPNKSSKMITMHLGNGCSITAIKDGKSIDHSLGFGTMTGLIMGTRSGDIDQAVIFHMVNTLGYPIEKVAEILQKKSGLLGLTGYSDMRDIEKQAEKGNKDCMLALEMVAYRVKKYIGSYTAIMNGVDALIFTAGVGENSSLLRKMICSDMDYLGIAIDLIKNDVRAKEITDISYASSKVKILIIPTNEELEIAKETYKILS